MKILVTGGLGFIGSNFILRTLKEFPNYKITNIDAMLPGSNIKNLKDIQKNNNYSFVKNNILNQRIIEKLISKNDVVINFAAESHVDRSIESGTEFIHSNVLGTYALLEQAREHKDLLTILISTDEVYGPITSGQSVEGSNLNPSSIYSVTKTCSDFIGLSNFRTFNQKIIITRCCNNYGPNQNEEKLIPRSIGNLLKGKNIEIYGDGSNVREWIHVSDHVKAIHKIFTEGKIGEIYNIGTSVRISNLALARKIVFYLNLREDRISYIKDRPGHDERYALDSSKLRDNLGWRDQIDFEKGLIDTIKWHKERGF